MTIEYPKTFVLVHGMSHGGWCWVKVADRLRALGHNVFTPTLTGVGERSHLMSADISLDTHIMDVVNVIKWERLDDVVLCGHSYGGWPVSGAVEHVPDQIASIVYLDAYMPEDGQCGLDIQSPESRAGVEKAIAAGDISRPAGSAARFGVTGDDLDWVDDLLTPQPIGVSLQPIKMTGARDRVAKKTYILAADYNSPAFTAYYEKLNNDPNWQVYSLPCQHDVMIEMPDELAKILIEVA